MKKILAFQWEFHWEFEKKILNGIFNDAMFFGVRVTYSLHGWPQKLHFSG